MPAPPDLDDEDGMTQVAATTSATETTLELSGGQALAQDAARPRRRPDLRHGRVPAAAVLRRGRGGGARASPRQRRALRRLHGRRIRPRLRPGRALRRDPRPGSDQPGHRPRRGQERRHPDDRDGRRHAPRPLRQGDDAGGPPAAPARAGLQGVPAHRGRPAHSRARPARVRDRDVRASGARRPRHPRRRLPRRLRLRARRVPRRPRRRCRAEVAVRPDPEAIAAAGDAAEPRRADR